VSFRTVKLVVELVLPATSELCTSNVALPEVLGVKLNEFVS